MNPVDIEKFYVSPYDKMFHGFDKDRKKSASQQKEIDKHARIAQLRDNPHAKGDGQMLWEDF